MKLMQLKVCVALLTPNWQGGPWSSAQVGNCHPSLVNAPLNLQACYPGMQQSACQTHLSNTPSHLSPNVGKFKLHFCLSVSTDTSNC